MGVTLLFLKFPLIFKLVKLGITINLAIVKRDLFNNDIHFNIAENLLSITNEIQTFNNIRINSESLNFTRNLFLGTSQKFIDGQIFNEVSRLAIKNQLTQNEVDSSSEILHSVNNTINNELKINTIINTDELNALKNKVSSLQLELNTVSYSSEQTIKEKDNLISELVSTNTKLKLENIWVSKKNYLLNLEINTHRFNSSNAIMFGTVVLASAVCAYVIYNNK